MDNTTPTTKNLGKSIGASGTKIFKGIITQEEYNSTLTGSRALRTYDIMRRSDSTVRSMLLVCKLPIMSAIWDVEPADPEDENDIYVANFVKSELFKKNINWTNFLREGLSCLDFGYSVAEKTYELTQFEGKDRIGIKSLGYRKQTTIWSWEMEDGQPGITQLLLDKKANIPLPKLIIFTNDKEGDNHEGISILRYAYKNWDMKDKLDLINAIALEKQGVGIPILEVPDDADQSDVDEAEESIRKMRANEEAYIKIPKGWSASMMDMKGNTTKEIIPTIHYHDRQIVRSVLAQFLELGSSDGSGSRSLSEDHSKLFIQSLEAVARQIQATVQEQLIKQLCDLNFSDLPNGYPKLNYSKIGDDNITLMSDALLKLAQAGMITADVETENYMRRMLNLPEVSEEQNEGDDKDGKTTIDKKTEKEAEENLEKDKKTEAALRDIKRNRKVLIDALR